MAFCSVLFCRVLEPMSACTSLQILRAYVSCNRRESRPPVFAQAIIPAGFLIPDVSRRCDAPVSIGGIPPRAAGGSLRHGWKRGPNPGGPGGTDAHRRPLTADGLAAAAERVERPARWQGRVPKSALTLVPSALACCARWSGAGSDCRGRPGAEHASRRKRRRCDVAGFQTMRHAPARSEGSLVRRVAEFAAYLRVRAPALTRAQRARACRQMLPIVPWGESMSEFFAPEWMRIRSR